MNDSKFQSQTNRSMFGYITDTSLYVHKHACSDYTPSFKNTSSTGTPSNIVDVDTDLKGLTRFMSKCTADKYQGASNFTVPKLAECSSDLKILPQGYIIRKK